MGVPRKLTLGGDFNNQRGINFASPVNPTDAANKLYVDNALSGLSWKQPVRVATTTSGTLATAYANGSTVDGVTLATGDRILLKDQATGTENGIYTVNASGAPTRATDGDTTAELESATVFVIAGATNANKGFTQTADTPVVGTTALVFAQVGGGTAYVGSASINLSGTTFSVIVKSGGGIVSDGSGLSIDPNAGTSAKRFFTTIPAGAATQTITHSLGTQAVHTTVYDVTNASDWVKVDADEHSTGLNTISVGFAAAVVANTYAVLVTA